MIFALTSLFFKWIVVNHKDMCLTQLMFDSNFITAILLLIPFACTLKDEGVWFSTSQVALSLLQFILQTIAIILMTHAIKLGQAGVVSSIENLKSLWLTILVALVQHQMPSSAELTGIVIGFMGATIILANEN